MSVDHLQPDKLHTKVCRKCNHAVSATTTELPTYALQSQAPPTRRQALDVQFSLQRDEASITEYTKEIRHAELALERLRAQRQVLLTNAERKRAFLAPIRRLPTDALAAIITYTLEDVFLRKPDSALLEQHAVLRVCQRWRAIALSATSIWAEIALYPMSYLNWHETLKRCLRRSQARALNITLNGACPPWRTGKPVSEVVPQGEWAAVLKPLLASAGRWKALVIDSICPPDALLRQRRRLPLLERLDLTSIHTPIRGADTYNLFEDCPSLYADVRLDDVDVRAFSLPWGSFHTLELAMRREDTIDDAIQCLAECKRVQTLTLTMYTRGPTSIQQLYLPALRYLDVREEARFILPHLVAPGTEEIRVGGRSFDDEDPSNITLLRRFAAAAKDNASRVHSLAIDALKGPAYNRDQWRKLFKCYPGVRRLCVSDPDMQDGIGTIPKLLTAYPDLLPSLTLLKFSHFQLNSGSQARALGPLADARTLDSRPAGTPQLVIEISDDFEGFGDEGVNFCIEKGIAVGSKRPKGAESSWQFTAFPNARPSRWPNYSWLDDEARPKLDVSRVRPALPSLPLDEKSRSTAYST
ncbi:uncharacterized protein SCHCODRAFT_02573505 [Schizophyllum commune H4-8]|nr:uncharacterized protein SCHCODRAFT_02573505 [Schizophyllum commune H4-8]KAI5895631.1 hypothetical protein SCHCODRAFT_02573505 [Schizophyllum commune H4-8]